MNAVAASLNNADALLERIEGAQERGITNGGEGLTALVHQFLADAQAVVLPHLSGRAGSFYALPDGTRVCCTDMQHWQKA